MFVVVVVDVCDHENNATAPQVLLHYFQEKFRSRTSVNENYDTQLSGLLSLHMTFTRARIHTHTHTITLSTYLCVYLLSTYLYPSFYESTHPPSILLPTYIHTYVSVRSYWLCKQILGGVDDGQLKLSDKL